MTSPASLAELGFRWPAEWKLQKQVFFGWPSIGEWFRNNAGAALSNPSRCQEQGICSHQFQQNSTTRRTVVVLLIKIHRDDRPRSGAGRRSGNRLVTVPASDCLRKPPPGQTSSCPYAHQFYSNTLRANAEDPITAGAKGPRDAACAHPGA